MEEFLGFDLGDAESAVAWMESGAGPDLPRILPVNGSGSFVSAVAVMEDGSVVVGEDACFVPSAVHRSVRFKSRFLESRESAKDLSAFAGGVLKALLKDGALPESGDKDRYFYVGCPAGWTGNERERYRAVFERAGYPPLKIVSESRAALVFACQSRHLQVGYDILKKAVLVIDIGSSTTDFAYVRSGRETALKTGGEVKLGGGIMDEILLADALEACPDKEAAERFFAAHAGWRSCCLFAARRLKEKYFSDEPYWQEHPCTQTMILPAEKPLRLQLRMDRREAERLLSSGRPELDGKSFADAFRESLRQAAEDTGEEKPELVFLTGGVSRMEIIRTWCEQAFPEAVIIRAADPEFSVARGLAWCGQVDWRLAQFRKEIGELIDGESVEEIVRPALPSLYRKSVRALTGPILEKAALPIFEKWRLGEISRLVDVDTEMERAIEQWLRSEEAKDLLTGPVTEWMRPIAAKLEDLTRPICVSHHVPYKALSLNSSLAPVGVGIRVEARSVLPVEEMTLLIDTIISVVVGLLCGGSGIALLSAGLPGIAAGALLSLVVLLLGKGRMESAFLRADVPLPVRRMIPKRYFSGRLRTIEEEVEQRFYEGLAGEKNEEITEDMTKSVAKQIEQCLLKMAEVVEIPLGQS